MYKSVLGKINKLQKKNLLLIGLISVISKNLQKYKKDPKNGIYIKEFPIKYLQRKFKMNGTS